MFTSIKMANHGNKKIHGLETALIRSGKKHSRTKKRMSLLAVLALLAGATGGKYVSNARHTAVARATNAAHRHELQQFHLSAVNAARNAEKGSFQSRFNNARQKGAYVLNKNTRRVSWANNVRQVKNGMYLKKNSKIFSLKKVPKTGGLFGGPLTYEINAEVQF